MADVPALSFNERSGALGSTTSGDHHMRRTTPFAAATVLIAALFLTACGNGDDSQGETSSGSLSSQVQQTTPKAQQTTTSTKPVSKSAAVVQRFTSALDDLGIKHGDPQRAEVGMSGAQMIFELPVNGYDAGINIFPTADALSKWQEASDSLGGIHVALPDEYAVLTLNSSEGIADSAKIAPTIAEAVGGTAHGV